MSADTELAGRHVVVTGGGRGIGAAIATELARTGALVTLVARSSGDLESVAKAIRAAGGEARTEVADVTDVAALERAVDSAHSAHPLWGCVAAAGLNRTGPTVEYDLADLDLLWNTNVRATFALSQFVGARLLERGEGGRVLMISSQMGSVGYPGRAAYCTTKHAVNGLTKALAVEWAPHGITVNAIAPTFIGSAMTAGMLADPGFLADVLARIPLGRLGTLDEVAAAAGFLMSPRASLITGDILLTDGGWTAW